MPANKRTGKRKKIVVKSIQSGKRFATIRRGALARLTKLAETPNAFLADLKLVIDDVNLVMAVPKDQRPGFDLIALPFIKYFESLKYESYKLLRSDLKGIYSQEDLVNTAILRLAQKYRDYDETRRYKFSTYVENVQLIMNRIVWDINKKHEKEIQAKYIEKDTSFEEDRLYDAADAHTILKKYFARMTSTEKAVVLLLTGMGKSFDISTSFPELKKRFKKANIAKIKKALVLGNEINANKIANLFGVSPKAISKIKIKIAFNYGLFEYKEHESTTKMRANILALLFKGKNTSQIAKELGIAQPDVASHVEFIRKHAFDLTPSYKFTITKGKILVAILNGKNQTEIAKELKISRDAVKTHILYLEKYWPELRAYLKIDPRGSKPKK